MITFFWWFNNMLSIVIVNHTSNITKYETKQETTQKLILVLWQPSCDGTRTYAPRNTLRFLKWQNVLLPFILHVQSTGMVQSGVVSFYILADYSQNLGSRAKSVPLVCDYAAALKIRTNVVVTHKTAALFIMHSFTSYWSNNTLTLNFQLSKFFPSKVAIPNFSS